MNGRSRVNNRLPTRAGNGPLLYHLPNYSGLTAKVQDQEAAAMTQCAALVDLLVVSLPVPVNSSDSEQKVWLQLLHWFIASADVPSRLTDAYLTSAPGNPSC